MLSAELSVIIPTFNSTRFIGPCLDSIFAQGDGSIEVIVIDNGSSDGTPDFVRVNYRAVCLLENEKNLGAAKARNMGIAASRGEWVFTQDCDVILEKQFFSRVMPAIKEMPSAVGMIQPKILMTDKKTIYSCGAYLSGPLKRFYDIGKGQADRGQFNKAGDIFGACAAAAFYRRKMLEEIKDANGYFDERFFFLAEDVDLSLRAQAKGCTAVYFPGAVCFHQGNSSSTARPLRQYLCWRNRKLMLGKFKLSRPAALMIFLVYDFPRLVYLLFTNPYVRNDFKFKI